MFKSVMNSEKFCMQKLKLAVVTAVASVASRPTLAAGLDDGTTALSDIQTWGYTFLGVACTVYCIYLVVMALLEKKQWGDVFMGIAKTACGGGIVVGASWAWTIWGS